MRACAKIRPKILSGSSKIASVLNKKKDAGATFLCINID
jgi:hypothetical protein